MRSYFVGGSAFPVVPRVRNVKKIPAESISSNKGSLFILIRYFIALGIYIKNKAKKRVS
jgi:hypothetical protein